MRPFFLLFPALALAATDWASLLDRDLGARVHFGAELGGREPFRRNETESFAPASTAKVLTAGALLAAEGPEFRYPTRLRWVEVAPGTAAELTLVGSGDPSWGLEELHEGLRDRFDAIAGALKAVGVTIVQGEPVAAASDERWNAPSLPEGWKPTDSSSCDGALAQAFNLALNCGTLRIASATSAAWSEPGLRYPVMLDIGSGSSTSLRARFNGRGFTVEGTWKKGQGPVSLRLPIYDTRPWAGALLRAALAAKGIRFVPASPRAPGAPRELAFLSPPLRELVKPFLKNSINLMGDAFLKTLAAGQPGAGLLGEGLARLESFLRRYGDTRDLALHDGSGLSRTSRLPPAFLYAYLAGITGESWFPALLEALPVAGVDGTLRNRMKGTAAEGVLRGKTGTLDGVYNLAGYVPHGKGYTAFVLLTSTTPDLSQAAKAAEDRVGAALAALHFEPLSSAPSAPAPYPYVPEHAGRDAE